MPQQALTLNFRFILLLGRVAVLSSLTQLPSAVTAAKPKRASRAVAAWLLGCCGLIFLMVVVGGITRLTLSGLSITEWKPIIGVIPPLTHAQWAAEFARYRQVPEFRAIHYGMTLAEFKGIYFWEYVHRLLGRLIGVAFAGPLVWFWLRGQLPRRFGLALGGILALGFTQGLLGWYMVESGLAERVEVSQYRLVAHLGLALAIYSLILWTALRLCCPSLERSRRERRIDRLASRGGGADRADCADDRRGWICCRHPRWAYLQYVSTDGRPIRPHGL